MLVDQNGAPISRVSHEPEFKLRCTRLTSQQMDEIEAEINKRVDAEERSNGDLIFCSSWIAGADWSQTPLDPIYRVCGEDEEVAKLFYGQWCWYVLMRRQDKFMFERFEHLGPDRICGLTYWRWDS